GGGSPSWLLCQRVFCDGLVPLVEQRDTVAQEEPVDLGLALLDQPVELTLPVLVRGAHAHADAIAEPWAPGLLQQWHNLKRRVALPGEEAGHRAPQYPDVDLAGFHVLDHRVRR